MRVPTGVPGLDSLLQGGLPPGSAVLVTGAPGTGKTTIAGQFLWTGLQRGETAVFVTLDQSVEDLRADLAQFGWDLAAMEQRGLLKLIRHDPAHPNDLAPLLARDLGDLGASRLAIDPVTLLSLDHPHRTRRALRALLTVARTATTLLVSESTDGPEEFAADGILHLRHDATGRTLAIKKMRRTRHTLAPHALEFTESGLALRRR